MVQYQDGDRTNIQLGFRFLWQRTSGHRHTKLRMAVSYIQAYRLHVK